MVMGRRSWRKASISSADILMRSRCLTPWPICCGALLFAHPILPGPSPDRGPRLLPGQRIGVRRAVQNDAVTDFRGRPGSHSTRPGGPAPLSGVLRLHRQHLPVAHGRGGAGQLASSDLTRRRLRPRPTSLDVSSAGTSGWHAGEPMDPRARSALERRGYIDHGHRARPFPTAWFDITDLVVCMDRGHQQTLLGLARTNAGDDRYRGAPGHAAQLRPPGRGSRRRARSLLRRGRRLRHLPGPWWRRGAGGWSTTWSTGWKARLPTGCSSSERAWALVSGFGQLWPGRVDEVAEPAYRL